MNLFIALNFKLKSIPFSFNFFFCLVNSLFFISCLSCLHVVQNPCIYGIVVLLPWSPNMNRRMTRFTYVHVKTMFVVQMSMKEPFSCVIVDASIELANPPWPLMNLIYIFHGMIQWYFFKIIFMWSHLSPYKFESDQQVCIMKVLQSKQPPKP
jgi:hypothetical protein